MSCRAFIIPSYNNKNFSSSELLPGDFSIILYILTDILAFLITDCVHVNAHDGITLELKNTEKQAQRTNIFFTVRRNYKRTRGHKRSVYKFSLHVNNHEIDQEKQNKTVAR